MRKENEKLILEAMKLVMDINHEVEGVDTFSSMSGHVNQFEVHMTETDDEERERIFEFQVYYDYSHWIDEYFSQDDYYEYMKLTKEHLEELVTDLDEIRRTGEINGKKYSFNISELIEGGNK